MTPRREPTKLNLAVHEGPPGADGTTTLTTGSVSGCRLQENPSGQLAAANGFEYTSQKVGGRHYPATINNTANGNSNSTLAVVSIAAGTYDFDYRVEVEAQTIVTPTRGQLRRGSGGPPQWGSGRQ